MPGATITIDREQREGLYELVHNHLGSIEDFWSVLERTKDFTKAEQLGLELAADFRLLQDIDWGEGRARRKLRPDHAARRAGGAARSLAEGSYASPGRGGRGGCLWPRRRRGRPALSTRL